MKPDRLQLWLGLALAISVISLCETRCKGAVFFGQEIPTNVTTILFAPGTHIIHTNYTNVSISGFDLSERVEKLEKAKKEHDENMVKIGKLILVVGLIALIIFIYNTKP